MPRSSAIWRDDRPSNAFNPRIHSQSHTISSDERGNDCERSLIPRTTPRLPAIARLATGLWSTGPEATPDSGRPTGYSVPSWPVLPSFPSGWATGYSVPSCPLDSDCVLRIFFTPSLDSPTMGAIWRWLNEFAFRCAISSLRSLTESNSFASVNSACQYSSHDL